MCSNMLAEAKMLAGQLSAWRRDFHQHPELSFQEFRTAGVVAQTLGEIGLEVQTGIAKTGVVGYLGEGAMFMLGASPSQGMRLHHTPTFDIDESTLPTGAALLAETTVRLLKRLADEKI
jgi:metal-dependent amidase/aminoacylase/carboxypeptidase family protein